MTECQHPDIWGRGGECRVCGESVLNHGLSGLHRFHRLKADILLIHDSLGFSEATHTQNEAADVGCTEDVADWSNLIRSSEQIARDQLTEQGTR